MKYLFFFFIILCQAIRIDAQNTISPDSLDNQISEHFKTYMAELFRYEGLSGDSETKTIFSQQQIDRELKLMHDVMNSGLISQPTKNVVALCHNILIHSTEQGEMFLRSLNNPALRSDLADMLPTEFVFSGESGEALAFENLTADDPHWRRKWSGYLGTFAIYPSSTPKILKILEDETEYYETRKDMLMALIRIGDTSSINLIKHIIETTSHSEQATAIFALTELAGYDARIYIENVKPVGEEPEKDKQEALEWLADTSPQNRFGTNVRNDLGFIEQHKNTKSPAMNWIRKEGLLKLRKAKKPRPLPEKKKNELLNLLIESKGFGLDAVKGHLFLSIEPGDIDKLLTLRQMLYYSPASQTNRRLTTVMTFIRHLRIDP